MRGSTCTEDESLTLSAGVETIAGGLTTDGHVGDHLALLVQLLVPHDAPEPLLVLVDVAVLHFTNQEVLSSLSPARQALKLCL